MLHKFNQLFLFQKKERRKKNYLSLLRLEMQTQISLFFFFLGGAFEIIYDFVDL